MCGCKSVYEEHSGLAFVKEQLWEVEVTVYSVFIYCEYHCELRRTKLKEQSTESDYFKF
jgi:hypothetical protein